MVVQSKSDIFQPPLQLGGIIWLNSDPLNVSKNVVWDFQESCLKGTLSSGRGLFCFIPSSLLTVWNAAGMARASTAILGNEDKCHTLVTVDCRT